MAVKGLADDAEILLQGASMDARIDGAIEQASVERTIAGASTVNMLLLDPTLELIDHPLLNSKCTTTVDGLPFDLVHFEKQADALGLSFEAAGVADLRKKKGILVAKKGTTTRTKFARRLVGEVGHLRFLGETGSPNLTALARGGKSNPGENSWDCLNRLAQDRQWRCFESEQGIYFGSDKWLAGLSAPLTISPFDDGINDIDFSWDGGKKADSATVYCNARVWASGPGAPINLNRMGALASKNVWLVEAIQRDLFLTDSVITLIRKTAELDEPKPSISSATKNGSGPAGGSSVQGTSAQGFQWPVTGGHPITSPFGVARPGHIHEGIDIGVPDGTAIYATKDGTVSAAGGFDPGGYGVAIYIEHGGGFESPYGHLRECLVRVGQQVNRGEQIAWSDSTGDATGPHLHFEIRVGGAAQDPLIYLP